MVEVKVLIDESHLVVKLRVTNVLDEQHAEKFDENFVHEEVGDDTCDDGTSNLVVSLVLKLLGKCLNLLLFSFKNLNWSLMLKSTVECHVDLVQFQIFLFGEHFLQELMVVEGSWFILAFALHLFFLMIKQHLQLLNLLLVTFLWLELMMKAKVNKCGVEDDS